LKGGSPQSIRHEHLSGLLLFEPFLSSWLADGDHIDRDVVAAAILCHHLKVNEETLARPMHAGDFELSLPLGRPELLTLLAHVTAPGTCPSQPQALRWRRDSVLQRRESLRLKARQFKASLRQDRLRFHLTGAVKAALIVADAAGSAVTREGLSLDAWISLCFDNSRCTPDWLDDGTRPIPLSTSSNSAPSANSLFGIGSSTPPD
jgi:CRISPR-associated endonuclease/helicase Cas3